MSPKVAHSSKGVDLFPISHSNKFHNFSFCITISISITVLNSVVTVNELVVTVLDSVMKLVVDTVIDLFITVLDLLVKK